VCYCQVYFYHVSLLCDVLGDSVHVITAMLGFYLLAIL